MSKSMTYVIMGNPIPWARPGKSKYSHQAYDTQKAEKLDYGWVLKAHHGSDAFFEGPLHLDLIFYMPITKTTGKRKGERLGQYHIFKPDLSNLCKFIEDAATEILYHDDCIIASCSMKKVWDENPRTEMTITELKPKLEVCAQKKSL